MELSYSFLQHYWWFIISLLGGVLVFLMFVQGGQGLLYRVGRNSTERDMIIESIGSKWKLAFTTLVTFGGALFASFPLFYSTSFSGAFYLWMLILLLFVLQAVAYEFRSKPANYLGKKSYEWFLMLNGSLGAFLLGVVVGMFFTGADFTVDTTNITNIGGDTSISRWTSPWRGLEALADYRNLLLGATVLMLSRVLALEYFINDIDDDAVRERSVKQLWVDGALFVLFALSFVVSLLLSSGVAVMSDGGFVLEEYKYLHNFIALPTVGILFLAGVVSILWGITAAVVFNRRDGIWYGGIGTIVMVTALIVAAGYNGTAYYHSLVDINYSLSIFNSSSSRFTLLVMSYVSLIIPIVAIYIWLTWCAMNRKKVTRESVSDGGHY